jgi:hypothetical protein
MNQQIVTWVKYDEKIKEHTEAVKKLRVERDKLGESLITEIEKNDQIEKDNLPTYNITELNTSLSFQNTKTYENYTNKFYTDCFTEFLGSEEKAKELLEFMKKKRKVESKITLKRGYLMDM